MKLVKFRQGTDYKWGALQEDTVRVIIGDIFGDYALLNQYVAVDDIQLLAPCMPTKVVCVGLNYSDHAKEMKLQLPAEPTIFLKPPSAVINPFENIVYPTLTKNLHYEAELAIVIKKTAKYVSCESAADYILGYTCANDVTARDLQIRDGQWTRGKAFDTFLPIGPCIVTEIDPHNINVWSFLNGQIRQSSNTRNMIFSVYDIVAFITEVMTLYPGDIILTGTPSGVGPMQVGDTIVVELEGIGKLTNKVVQETYTR